MNNLEPDRNEIEIFIDALLRYRGEAGYLSLRAFYHDQKPLSSRLWRARLNGNGLQYLIDQAVDMARRAANDPQPAVFCPPLAVFNAANGWQAREEDLLLGLALSVECDEHPEEARQKLQDIVGGVTAIVRSGGQWIDPGDGLPQDKLHLHWRLRVPATGDSLPKLKRARMLATAIVGGDTSNVTAVHPIRWPGSWHRKKQPRLCESVTVNPDREIDLDEAVAALEAAAPDLETAAGGPHQPSKPQTSVERIAAALAVIPNNEDWDGWNTVGMATWRATGGSAAGFVAFDAWSRKSPKHDAHNTAARWAGYFKSPPTSVGAGTIIHRADQASPNWWQGEPPEDEPDDPGPRPLLGPERRPEEPRPEEPLPYVDLSLDLVDREWFVLNRIPMYNVTLLSGEGAIGKSKLALQASCAAVLPGAEWIGTPVAHGPVLYISCEEDDDELRRQIEDVAVHLGSTRQELAKRGLRPLSFAGKDAVLAQPNRRGIMWPTRLFKRIQRDALKQRPKLIVIDTAADTFGGKEIDRAQTRQFITMLRGLAIECGCAVLLIAHPSLTGIQTKSGLSGSTGWHNGPRARMYFRANDDDNDNAEPTLRILEIMKNNYGPPTAVIRVRWKEGVFVTVDPRQQELDLGAGEATADKLFFTLLRRLTREGRNVTDKTGTTYAPATFAQQPEAKNAKVTGKALAESMQRLFAAGKIRVVTEGPPSRPRSRIVEASTAPSTDVPPPSTGLATHPPLYPPARWKRAVHGGSAPPATTGQEEGVRVDEPGLARVLEAWRAAFGTDRTVSIDELVAVEHGDLKAALLAVAAMIDTDSGAAYPEPAVSNVRLGRWLREANGVRLGRLSLQRRGVGSTGSQLWSLRVAAESISSGWDEEP